MSHRNGSLVVELVGPAGVGKTTLAHKIQRVDPRVHVGLSVWGLPRARLLRGAIGLVPTIVMAVLRRRRLRWVEITYMIRLEALRRVLRRVKARHRVIILDEGPVFGMSWLDLAFAERGVRPPARWRRRTLARWVDVLDSVILLDAGNEELAERIRSRSKMHRMMNGSDRAIQRFANDYRKAFDTVIDDLGRAGRLAVHQVRTDGPLNRSTARLKSMLARYRHGH